MGGSDKLACVGAWTSTLNLAVAVTLVTCWVVGVEHLDDPPLPLPVWKRKKVSFRFEAPDFCVISHEITENTGIKHEWDFTI